jgi:hypothetical protein
LGGILGALVAACRASSTCFPLPWTTKRIALIHMSINLTVVAFYVVNAYLRRNGVTVGLAGREACLRAWRRGRPSA